MASRVKVIPASKNKFTSTPISSMAKRKVAGYARVSTDMDEQQSSYAAQLAYYTNYIQSNPQWEFIGMYSDEGITGTSTARRDGFNRMIDDALAGKIDLIITKSVSRFARNTVDSLTTIRKLKDAGIEVFFEKENIYTLDSKGELLITIMSSLAQEESRSISENTTWGKRKQFADGIGWVAFSHFLGYDKGPDGSFVINEEEAETVRLIYSLFLSGKSPYRIAQELTRREIKTPSGKDTWYASTVESILTNEKYKGDMLLQKSYTVDFLTHKTTPNAGQIPQYYVENHHEAIIDPETFDFVQGEMEKRKGVKRYCEDPLSGKIKCGLCGGFYGGKVMHSTEKYRSKVLRCNNKYREGIRCKSPVVPPEIIYAVIIRAVNSLVERKTEILQNIREISDMLTDSSELEAKLSELRKDMERAEREATSSDLRRRSRKPDESAQLQQCYDEARKDVEQLTQQIEERRSRKVQLDRFTSELERQALITEFDPVLLNSLVDYVTVYSKDDIRVTFRDGTTL